MFGKPVARYLAFPKVVLGVLAVVGLTGPRSHARACPTRPAVA